MRYIHAFILVNGWYELLGCSLFACLEAKVLKDTNSVDLFLHAESSSGNHGKTPVVQFLGLHIGKVSSIGGLKSKRVKANVSGVVVFPKSKEVSHTGLDPSSGCTPCLGKVDGKEKGEQSSSWDIGELVVGNHGVGESVGNGGGVLSDEVSDNGHHGDTSVHDFGFTESLDSLKVALLLLIKRVEGSC